MSATDTPGSGDAGPLDAAELQLLAQARRGHQWLRAVLCTVARRGVAYRAARPEAAAHLLAALASSPLFKAGQFLFDLMEWEDFMLDGEPPPLLPTALDPAALGRLAQFLERIKAHLDAASGLDLNMVRLEAVPGGVFVAEDLPPLEGGFYLYQDVVLGVLISTLKLLPDAAPASK